MWEEAVVASFKILHKQFLEWLQQTKTPENSQFLYQDLKLVPLESDQKNQPLNHDFRLVCESKAF